MSFDLSMAINLLVAVLLVITIGYCIILNKKLKAMRSAQDEMQQLIGTFNAAADKARSSVDQLKKTGDEIGLSLEREIDRAKAMRDDLALITDTAEHLASRIEQAVDASRGKAATSPSGPEAAAGRKSRGTRRRSESERELLAALRQAR